MQEAYQTALCPGSPETNFTGERGTASWCLFLMFEPSVILIRWDEPQAPGKGCCDVHMCVFQP